ncbi:transcriptional regulator family: Fungal Specific TF [Penicillium canescens]|nr:transcriptional regulator family: Fungal Specific TF [Penicillium canescens]KAJ6182086.1 transcriptional regulator family: Fungal Specific TF [Penicillium canescens]
MSFNANWQDNPSTDDERPAKARRIARACLQCRARKQRCLPSSEEASLQLPCKRCQRLSITCSFETDRAPTLDVAQSPSSLVQLVIELQNRLNQHETRILELESQKRQSDVNRKEPPRYVQPERQQAFSPSQSDIYHSPESSIDGIHLGPPIATLRSLRVLAEEQVHDSTPRALKYKSIYNPIHQGLLSVENVQRATEIGNSIGGHSRFHDLTKLLDKAVSRLLLRPTPADVTLDSICVLLLYAQWMPCSREDEDENSDRHSTHDTRKAKSRYNEISAWAVLGLAERYSVLLGLEQSATSFFKDPNKSPSAEDANRLRVWYNLLTCNFNLMLTSGLPVSIDPTPSVQVARNFVSSELMQSPADLRVRGLVELVGIVHLAMSSCGDISGRQLQPSCLERLNIDLDDWERSWFTCLQKTDSHYNHLPFTSARWYRLSLNCASLAPILSSPRVHRPLTDSIQPHIRQALPVSLTAAAQIILSQSSYKADIVFSLDSKNPSSFPDGAYHADRGSVSRLYYAVDSTWISHTFAITFLSLCYIRGLIDENLQIRSQTSSQVKGNVFTRLPSSSPSVLARLLRLALEIFDSVCPATTFHFAQDFQSIVHYAVSLVLVSEKNMKDIEREEIDDMAIQSLLDLMNNSGVDWAGNLFGESLDFPDLNTDGMLA